MASRKSIAVQWTKFPPCGECSHKVAAVDSQGAVNNCFVEGAQMAAICENLFPCMEYNITVRACGEKSGCGAPAYRLVSTKLGRKYISLSGELEIPGKSDFCAGTVKLP